VRFKKIILKRKTINVIQKHMLVYVVITGQRLLYFSGLTSLVVMVTVECLPFNHVRWRTLESTSHSLARFSR